MNALRLGACALYRVGNEPEAFEGPPRSPRRNSFLEPLP